MAVSIRGTGSRLSVEDRIAGEAVARLRHSLVIPKIAERVYEKYFEDKIGDTITIKLPFDVLIGDGRTMQASEVQGLIDRTIQMKVNNRPHMALGYYDDEVTLDIIQFGQRYLQAGVERMAYRYDQDGARELCNEAFYADGTPGTGITTQMAQDIGAHARHVAIPLDSMNYGIMDPVDFAEISNDIKQINVPDDVKGSIRQRFRGQLANFNLFESVHLPYLDVAANPGTPRINGANQEGDTLAMDGFPNNGRVFNDGQLFRIENVFEIQPRTIPIKSTGRLMTFAVDGDVTADGSGRANVKITKPLNAGTLTTEDGQGATISMAAFQNVTRTPADNAVVTIVGTPGKQYRQGVFYHQQALQYANVQLHQFQSVNLKGMGLDSETGLSVSMIAWFEGLIQREIRRLDSLYGVKNVYPEVVIRHIGKEVGT